MISDKIEQIAETAVDALEQNLHEELQNINLDQLKTEILYTIKKLKIHIELFEAESKKISATETTTALAQKLELKKELIYQTFFKLQNLINQYMGQKIILTYVHVDNNGQREIRLYDNTAENLEVQWGHSKFGKSYQKLGYEMHSHYTLLKNTLPEETNDNLQSTAKLVEERYNQTKKIVYWKIKGQKWSGYQFTNKGPINEAFVNFYINTKPNVNYFKYSDEKNVMTYVTHPKYGAIAADTQNGFLVGDVAKNGIQYAVKGTFASPQNFKAVIKALDKLDENISHTNLRKALKNFMKDAKKKAHRLIRATTAESIEKIINELQI